MLPTVSRLLSKNSLAHRTPWALWSVVVAVLSSCDCAGNRLVIVDPDDGATLGVTDDRDTTLGGLQYDVVVDVTGLPIGEPITVFAGTDPDTLLETGSSAVSVNEPDGRATVRVTLENGTIHLMACAHEGCSLHSPKRTILVEGSAGDCPLVQFLAPTPTGATGTLTLTAADDEAIADGACGRSFTTTVRARVQATDGTLATLFVDGIPTATVPVAANEVQFAEVALGVRGTDTSTLHIEVEGATESCATSFPQLVAVACGGPSCRLVSPSDTEYLNESLDEDTAKAGLDLNLVLEGSVNGVGRMYTISDVATASAPETLATVVAAAAGGKSAATFLGVPLAEGAVRFNGQCTDETGTTDSATAAYTVDTVPCTTTIDAPDDGRIFTATDDTDADLANGIQALGTVTVTGEACTDFRFAPCAAIPATLFAPLDGGAGSATLDLGTSGTQMLCAEARDEAGNLGTAGVSVSVVADGVPSVAIVTPTTGARINRDGGVYLGVTYLADENPSTTACDYGVTVDCSAIGTAVSLVVDGATASATQANCAANASSTLGGRATFSNLVFPVGATTAHTLVATQDEGGLVGTSPSVGVAADCEPPTLSVTDPTCGGSIGMIDDVSASAGIQTAVTIASPNQPQLDVTVAVATSGGASTSVTSLASSLAPNATSHTISAMPFGGAGTVQLAASAIDSFGNSFVTGACTITVTGLPAIDLTPLAVSSFNAANQAMFDCALGTPGLDLTIAGTTDATAGSAVTLQIGAGAPVMVNVVGGAFTGCVPAPEGVSQVNATVNDLVGSDGVSGMAAAIPLTVTVLTTAPTGAIEPVTVTTLDRRAGVVSLGFTAVADQASAPLASYVLRCRNTPIATEADWTAAAVIALDAHTPANPGVADSVVARGFLTGTTSQCVLRGSDAAANLTPLPTAGFVVSPQFLVATFDGAVSGGAMGVTGMRAAGDVNGDGLADFVVSGRHSAYLYLGQAGGALPVLATTFANTPVSNYFGAVTRGIGDFNGDGLDDIAIADPVGPSFAFNGEVFVFYGRASWPASITVDASTCVASFCVRPGSMAGLGFDVLGVGNFDGLAGEDLAIAAPIGDRVYVLSGRNDIASGTNFVLGTNDPFGFAIVSPNTLQSFGWTLGAPGNVTGSANPDLVIGQTGNWPDADTRPAVLYRVAGRNLAAGMGLTSIAAAEVTAITTDATLPSGFGTTDFFSIPFGDFDGDGFVDMNAFTYGSGPFSTGTYLLFGSAAADYPILPETRVATGVGGAAFGYFGVGRGIAFDPNFGHVGDIDGDAHDEVAVGGITMTNDGTFSVGLVYGRSPRPTATLLLENDATRIAILKPAAENYPTPTPVQFWLIGFPGDIVHDTTLAYPDLVITDSSAASPFTAADSGRIFVLY